MYNCAMHAEPLEVLAGKLLRQRCWQLAVAESCTGGLVGHLLTNVPGSSDYFLGGVISYANDAKLRLLGVHLETLETFGAVSRQTVLEMACGVRRLLSADVGLSVSGIAGPGGGTPEKPVGLTWIGLSASGYELAWQHTWDGNRLENKERSAQAVLQHLVEFLQADPFVQS
jgi:PncC family amidohydrolase